MRKLISGLVAAVAVMTAAPAMACGYSGCWQPQAYVAPVAPYGYSGCNSCGGSWGYGGSWSYRERLPDPEDQYGYRGHASQQYYYVNQGPTYSGPGDYAPRPIYREGAIAGYRHYGYRRHYRAHRHHYGHPVISRYY
jgi:hypothetical protein